MLRQVLEEQAIRRKSCNKIEHIFEVSVCLSQGVLPSQSRKKTVHVPRCSRNLMSLLLIEKAEVALSTGAGATGFVVGVEPAVGGVAATRLGVAIYTAAICETSRQTNPVTKTGQHESADSVRHSFSPTPPSEPHM